MSLGHHLRHNLVAYVALIVALGTGTAYAAEKIPNGSVTTKKLAANAVTSAKVKNGTLGSVDIADGGVGSADIQDGAVRSVDIADGAVGSVDIADGGIEASDLALGVLPPATFLDVTMGAGDPPSSIAENSSGPTSTRAVDLPRDGRYLVRAFAQRMALNCQIGFGYAGLYVDGAPVPRTRTNVSAVGDSSAVEIVTAVELSRGPHSLALRAYCSSDSGSYSGGPVSWIVLSAD